MSSEMDVQIELLADDIMRLPLDDQKRYIKLRRDEQAWERERLRTIVQNAAIRKVITPGVVEAYAAVHLADETTGTPIVAARHHKLWLEFLTDESIKRLLILSPYGSAKTVWAILAYVGTYIGIYPERSTIIACNSTQTAVKRSMALRSGVMSAEFKKTFPDLKPDLYLPWAQDQWTLMREGQPQSNRIHPTLIGYGAGGSVIGSRADLIIGDDVLDRENTSTQHQRREMSQWMGTTLLSRLKRKTGRAILIGTSWNVADYYSAARESGGWVVVHTPLLSDTDDFYATITYPDSWTGRTIGASVGELM